MSVDDKANESLVPPEYDVEEMDFSYLQKAMKKEPDALTLIKSLYLNTYICLTEILMRNWQNLDYMVTAAQLAIGLELAKGDAEALTKIHTMRELLSNKDISTKWQNTDLLERMVLGLPKEEQKLALSLLERYGVYLEVYDKVVKLKNSLEAPEQEVEDQMRVEVTLAKDFSQYSRKDCQKMLTQLLHKAFKIPQDKIMVVAARSGNSTTVVVAMDKAFLQNIVQHLFEVNTLWAFQELEVTRLRIPGVFKLSVSQLLTESFKEALHSGLTSGTDFIGITKVCGGYYLHCCSSGSA